MFRGYCISLAFLAAVFASLAPVPLGFSDLFYTTSTGFLYHAQRYPLLLVLRSSSSYMGPRVPLPVLVPSFCSPRLSSRPPSPPRRRPPLWRRAYGGCCGRLRCRRRRRCCQLPWFVRQRPVLRIRPTVVIPGAMPPRFPSPPSWR